MATKIGNWIFNKWPGMPVVGPMRCNTCGKRLNAEPNEYCYRHSAELCTNEFQCSECGKDEPHWQQLNAQRAEAAHKQWLDYARTDYDVLLERIKDAYFEGALDGMNGYSDQTCAEMWEVSDAKKIHDTLKKLWSEQ